MMYLIINNNWINWTGTVNREGVTRTGRQGMFGSAPRDCHQAIGHSQSKSCSRGNSKCEKEVNNTVMGCWLRNESNIRSFIKRMKRFGDDKINFESFS